MHGAGGVVLVMFSCGIGRREVVENLGLAQGRNVFTRPGTAAGSLGLDAV